MVKHNEIQGVVVPMITPFTLEGNVDTGAVTRIAEHIVSAGASLFVMGTTGEGASIHPKARAPLVEAVINQTQGRTLTYVSISDNCLEVSIEEAHRYAEMGVDLVVAHLPSYFPLRPKEMAHYFLTLADSIPIPLVLYNMPLTTKMSVPCHVIEQLSRHTNIVAIKDSENCVHRLEESMKRWKGRQDFKHLTGCTVLSTRALAMGANGIVPSPGNLIPSLYCRLYDAIQNGDSKLAEQMQACSDNLTALFHKDRPLCQSLPNLKAMMHACDLCDPFVLPPLQPVTDQQMHAIKTQLSTLEPLLSQP
jgi:4-hydroxy-tetrahydrodipicolinate synthase